MRNILHITNQADFKTRSQDEQTSNNIHINIITTNHIENAVNGESPTLNWNIPYSETGKNNKTSYLPIDPENLTSTVVMALLVTSLFLFLYKVASSKNLLALRS